mmetsp:Transcript_20869/g.58033  ORF Transcript_20869/g.58033 Transcript_20869/m.58033 type:complete len:210 (-) Transcript_20869:111-740(-)
MHHGFLRGRASCRMQRRLDDALTCRRIHLLPRCSVVVADTTHSKADWFAALVDIDLDADLSGPQLAVFRHRHIRHFLVPFLVLLCGMQRSLQLPVRQFKVDLGFAHAEIRMLGLEVMQLVLFGVRVLHADESRAQSLLGQRDEKLLGRRVQGMPREVIGTSQARRADLVGDADALHRVRGQDDVLDVINAKHALAGWSQDVVVGVDGGR